MIDAVDRTFIYKVCDFSSDSKTEIYIYISTYICIFFMCEFFSIFYGFAKYKLSHKSVSILNVSTTGIMGLLKNCHQGGKIQ